MKKIVASVGLVALGAASLQAAHAPGLSRTETSKPWSISASLRGFYDDNYTTSPKDFKEESLGIEFSPSISVNFPLERTYIGLSYTYSLIYYEAREDEPVDHQHEFTGKLDHKFSDRFNVRLDESFVYSQEPEVIDPNYSFPLRTDADTLRNRAKIRFRAEMTQVLGLEVAYQNVFYDYTDEGPGSRSALLDRLEHLVNLDLRYLVNPNLIGILGYQYGQVGYTGDEYITPDFESDIRDNNSHYLYVGGEHSLTRQLTANLKAGAQYTDYSEVDENEWNPYVEIGFNYTYLPGSYLQMGLKHTRLPTDVVGTDAEAVTLDQETTIVYGSVTHRITPQLSGNMMGQFQTGSFNQGSADGDVDNFFGIGVNLDYSINQYWSAEVGYNWDRLDSDQLYRSYSRNRVYLGVRATY